MVSELGGGAKIPPVPRPPTLFKVNKSSNGKITFKWNKPLSNGGPNPDDYTIWYKDEMAAWKELASGVIETEYTYQGRLSNSLYKFKIQARNLIGYGEFSSEKFLWKPQIKSQIWFGGRDYFDSSMDKYPSDNQLKSYEES